MTSEEGDGLFYKGLDGSMNMNTPLRAAPTPPSPASFRTTQGATWFGKNKCRQFPCPVPSPLGQAGC